MTIDLRDVTDYAPLDAHFPECVQAFEDLGFVRLGRMAIVHAAGLEKVASFFPKPYRQELMQMKAIPPTVLASADGSAFVLVDWWCGMPDVRLRTVLTTGAIVETKRSWEVTPVWLSSERKLARSFVLGEEQCRLAGRGRDIEVASGDPAMLWRAHQTHVSAYKDQHDGTPIAHREMAQALAMSTRLTVHAISTERRWAWLQIAFHVILIGFVLTSVWIASAAGIGVALVVFAVEILATRSVSRWLLVWMRYERRLRPRFA